MNLLQMLLWGDLSWCARGYDGGSRVVTVQSANAVISPENNTVYKCGTLTDLTIVHPPATGSWMLVFTSGSTATTTVIPSSIHGLEDFAAETNTRYELNVMDGYAELGGWRIST